MASPADTYAFIGLGAMGYPMAVNLRKGLGKDKAFIVCDVNIDACKQFKEEASQYGNVEIVDNGYQAAQAANTVFSVMPSNNAVTALYLDPDAGILAGAKAQSDQSKILIECGTIAESTIKEVGNAASQSQNLQFVDAPISGGPLGSKSATLTFMVGSSDALFQSLHPLLSHMGTPSSIFHCGDLGAGTAFKQINNYISLISILAVSEGYNIASRMGLDLEKLTEVLRTGSAQNWVISKNHPVPGITPGNAASKGYEGGFRLELAIKDLGLGIGLGEGVGAETELASKALAVFKKASGDERYAGKDSRVLYKYLLER